MATATRTVPTAKWVPNTGSDPRVVRTMKVVVTGPQAGQQLSSKARVELVPRTGGDYVLQPAVTTLTLTDLEARTLCHIAGSITGPNSGRRGICDRIYQALVDALYPGSSGLNRGCNEQNITLQDRVNWDTTLTFGASVTESSKVDSASTKSVGVRSDTYGRSTGREGPSTGDR